MVSVSQALLSLMRSVCLVEGGINKKAGNVDLPPLPLTPHTPTPQLQILLNGCSIGPRGERTLALALRANANPLLTTLHLGGNAMCELGARFAIADALRDGVAPALQELKLGFNYLDVGGARSLAAALQSGSLRQLRTLDVHYNRLANTGAYAISAALRSGAVPLLADLDISYNDMASWASATSCWHWRACPTSSGSTSAETGWASLARHASQAPSESAACPASPSCVLDGVNFLRPGHRLCSTPSVRAVGPS